MQIKPVLFGAVKRPKKIDYSPDAKPDAAFIKAIATFKAGIAGNKSQAVVFRISPVNHANNREQMGTYFAIDATDGTLDLNVLKKVLKDKLILPNSDIPGFEGKGVDAALAVLQQRAKTGTDIKEALLLLKVSETHQIDIPGGFYLLKGNDVQLVAALVEKSGAHLIAGKHYLAPVSVNAPRVPVPAASTGWAKLRKILHV